MRQSSQLRKQPEREAAVDAPAATISAPGHDESDGHSSRRAQPSAGGSVHVPTKGQALVGKDVEVFWVISPEDGEQRAATEPVVKGAIGPKMDRQLVGRWHSAKVLRAKGCRVEIKYTADDWVAWCNLYAKNAHDYISPEYWREPGPKDQQPPINMVRSIVVGDDAPELELAAFVSQVNLSQSTLKTYANCIREIICDGASFGLADGALLAATSTDTAVSSSERNKQSSGAHRSSLRKFLKFLSKSSVGEQAGPARDVAAARSHKPGKNGSQAVKRERAQAAHTGSATRPTSECADDLVPSDDHIDIDKLGKFERRRKGSSVWEPYSKLICERLEAAHGWQGLIPVAHVQRDVSAGSKVWLFAQEGESIRGNLPWTPSVCSAALAKGSDAQATPGAFYVSVGVLSEDQLKQAENLKEHLPWERHSLTAFAQPGQGCEDTPAPKRRALLVSCEDETTSYDATTTFVYQPHRSGGLSGRPNLSMTSTPCQLLGEDGRVLNTLMHALCDHNDSLGFPDAGLACVTNRKTAPSMSHGKPVRNIGEGLLYSGGEELRWHHDGNQIVDWLTQKDVLSSFILQQTGSPRQSLRTGECRPGSLPDVKHSDLPAALAIKPHDRQWPQVRLHPPAGSKVDLVGTGKIAEHARKPISKHVPGASLLVFVGRRMVDEGLEPLPAMTQACPWDGKPVPQPLNDVVPVYGPIPNINPGEDFDSIAAIQKLGSHAHVGFHGRAVSSTVSAGSKSPIARGVQSVIHYNYEMHELDESGESGRFCVYSTPRRVKTIQGDALAVRVSPCVLSCGAGTTRVLCCLVCCSQLSLFGGVGHTAILTGNIPLVQFALSGAAGSPIQYFVSGREGSIHAPDIPGHLRYHGVFYVHDWKWIRSTDKMDGFVALPATCAALHVCLHTLPKLASHEMHFQHNSVANLQLRVGRCHFATVLG